MTTTLLSVFATFNVGGPQVRYTALANRFPDRYRHLVIAMDDGIAARNRLAPEVDATFPSVGIRKGRTLRNLGRFRRAIRSVDPDLLITHNWGSIEWAMANLPRMVRHIHVEDGFGPEEQSTQIPRRVLTRRLVLARSLVIVPSRNLERIATGIWRLDSRLVCYIPNGIDLARFAPVTRNARIPVIGTVAALRPEKNLSRLLRAFALVRSSIQAELIVVGDGPERPRLENLASELGVSEHVRFTGYTPDPAPRYREFDIFALSSDTEQMPISVVEAMAAGLPVAGTNVGDVRDMVAPENSPYITPLAPEPLAAALTALLNGPDQRAHLGMLNRARAELEYDQEKMFQTYASHFDGQFRGRHRRPNPNAP